jgi:hypothetical protein
MTVGSRASPAMDRGDLMISTGSTCSSQAEDPGEEVKLTFVQPFPVSAFRNTWPRPAIT